MFVGNTEYHVRLCVWCLVHLSSITNPPSPSPLIWLSMLHVLPRVCKCVLAFECCECIGKIAAFAIFLRPFGAVAHYSAICLSIVLSYCSLGSHSSAASVAYIASTNFGSDVFGHGTFTRGYIHTWACVCCCTSITYWNGAINVFLCTLLYLYGSIRLTLPLIEIYVCTLCSLGYTQRSDVWYPCECKSLRLCEWLCVCVCVCD